LITDASTDDVFHLSGHSSTKQGVRTNVLVMSNWLPARLHGLSGPTVWPGHA